MATQRRDSAGLAHRKRLFVREYLRNGFNGYAAAVKAGYPESSARSAAWYLLTKPDVKAAVAKGEQRLATVLECSAADSRRSWRTMVKTTIRDFLVNSNGELQLRPGADPNAWEAIASVTRTVRRTADGGEEITVRYRLADKAPYHKLLAQHHDLIREGERAAVQQTVILQVVEQVVERGPDGGLVVVQGARVPVAREGLPGPEGQAAASPSDPAETLPGGVLEP
jgi:phage terminase small subunit